MRDNPYNQADDFIGSFAGVLSMLDRTDARQEASARADRAEARLEEDRALYRQDRDRRIALEDVDRAEAAADRKQERELRGVQLDVARTSLAAAESPAEAKARRSDETTARRQALRLGSLQLDEATAKVVESRATKAQKEALPVIHEIGSLLTNAPDQVTDQDVDRFTKAWDAFGVDLPSMMTPEYEQAEKALRTAIREGKPTDPATLPAWNLVFKNRLNRTSGEVLEAPIERPDGMGGKVKVPKGSKILERELVGVKEAGDGVYPILRVAYETPDGQQGTYLAPADKDRMAKSNGDPLFIRYDDAMRQVMGRAALRNDLVSNPGVKARIDAFLTARGVTAADAKNLGSMGKDLEYLTAQYTGGDREKAIELYERLKAAASKPRNERFELVKAMLQSTGRTPDAESVNQLMAIASPDAAAAAGGAGGEGSYVEGQVYEDANGNRAIYRNGQFEPVE